MNASYKYPAGGCAPHDINSHTHGISPVISYGILAFTADYNDDYNACTREVLPRSARSAQERIRVLLIQRRHTIGYNDLIRGRYFFNNKQDIVKQYLTEMTPEEREKIRVKKFDELWDDLWFNHASKHYRCHKDKARYKYELLNIPKLLCATKSKYDYEEFGIPKGQKNKKETELQCAKREFEEETGYGPRDYSILDMEPVEETFMGSNNIIYRHIYFFALMNKGIKPPVLDRNNVKQCEEVKNLDFFYLCDAIRILRDYDHEKKNIILKSFEKVNKYFSLSNETGKEARIG